MWRFAVDMTNPVSIKVAFEVNPVQDSVVALVGPNGAGKSTLLRALAGFWGPHQGGLAGPPWKRPLTWVPQEPTLFAHRTVRDQVEWILRGRLDRDPELQQWVTWLDADEFLHKKPMAMSGGQQQRASILRALAAKPKILALDEALSQIDAPSRERISTGLRQWADADPDRLIILTTHQFTDVAHLADRILIMASGQLLRDGAPGHIVAEPRSWQVAALVGYVALLRVGETQLALRSHDVDSVPPGRRVEAAIVKETAHEVIVRVPALSGRELFTIRKSVGHPLCSPTLDVYVRGVAVT
jgi:iron(III) transport system ATP-binding protein